MDPGGIDLTDVSQNHSFFLLSAAENFKINYFEELVFNMLLLCAFASVRSGSGRSRSRSGPRSAACPAYPADGHHEEFLRSAQKGPKLRKLRKWQQLVELVAFVVSLS